VIGYGLVDGALASDVMRTRSAGVFVLMDAVGRVYRMRNVRRSFLLIRPFAIIPTSAEQLAFAVFTLQSTVTAIGPR
jgi:hypothetical protein